MGTPRDWHLTPAMRLQAQLGTVKDVEAGHGISYGRTYLTPDNTSTAIVPLATPMASTAPLPVSIWKVPSTWRSRAARCAS